jgi:hypothetical protein
MMIVPPQMGHNGTQSRNMSHFAWAAYLLELQEGELFKALVTRPLVSRSSSKSSSRAGWDSPGQEEEGKKEREEEVASVSLSALKAAEATTVLCYELYNKIFHVINKTISEAGAEACMEREEEKGEEERDKEKVMSRVFDGFRFDEEGEEERDESSSLHQQKGEGINSSSNHLLCYSVVRPVLALHTLQYEMLPFHKEGVVEGVEGLGDINKALVERCRVLLRLGRDGGSSSGSSTGWEEHRRREGWGACIATRAHCAFSSCSLLREAFAPTHTRTSARNKSGSRSKSGRSGAASSTSGAASSTRVYDEEVREVLQLLGGVGEEEEEEKGTVVDHCWHVCCVDPCRGSAIPTEQLSAATAATVADAKTSTSNSITKNSGIREKEETKKNKFVKEEKVKSPQPPQSNNSIGQASKTVTMLLMCADSYVTSVYWAGECSPLLVLLLCLHSM